MTSQSERLPIDSHQELILATIADSPVVILTAETGAGKSTRVPVWLWKHKKRVRVTQPRRIAARSLSHFLSAANRVKWGEEIGYQTGFDSRRSARTQLLYLTDGVQMIREIRGIKDYDVLILDEIHEWNLNQEVLVGLVKKMLTGDELLKSGRRVVIMSATLEARTLSSYLDQAPVISLSGRGYPVSQHHHQSLFMLPDTVQMVENGSNVLVFLPGKGEIENFSDSLKRMLRTEKLKAQVVPLHSELTIKEQARAFEHYPVPKVVLATDIAQTSLTIDDIDAVIDSGLKKEVQFIRGIEGLYPVDISASECQQRAGRAGRVKPGNYILCADLGQDDRQRFPETEIRRLNLESVALRLLKWGISPLEFPFFHAPNKSLMLRAVKKLFIFGAIDENNAITADGRDMAELPVTLRNARMLVEARKEGGSTLNETLKMIAILETRGIVNKEYIGETVSQLPIQSDLLNHLLIWQNVKANRRLISGKKHALAQEMVRELKKRLLHNQTSAASSSRQGKKTHHSLYRVILSGFVDFVFLKNGSMYEKNGEFRQLDRTSVLYNRMPAMIVGLPFDLVVQKENYDSGLKETFNIPLITFATEVGPDLLDLLKPFSYSRTVEAVIENEVIHIVSRHRFGGEEILVEKREPRMKSLEEREMVVAAIFEWIGLPPSMFSLADTWLRLRKEYRGARRILGVKLKPLKLYWSEYFRKEIGRSLNTNNLALFFNLRVDFRCVTLGHIIPGTLVKELENQKWPARCQMHGFSVRVIYIQRKAYIKPPPPVLEKLNRQDLLLPTGKLAGILFRGKRIDRWDQFVPIFNKWKRTDFFRKRWRDQSREVDVKDIKELLFPLTFQSGIGKENEQFEYYSVLRAEGDVVSLVHFEDLDSARDAYLINKEAVEKLIQRFKKIEMDQLFKQKGWKVK